MDDYAVYHIVEPDGGTVADHDCYYWDQVADARYGST